MFFHICWYISRINTWQVLWEVIFDAWGRANYTLAIPQRTLNTLLLKRVSPWIVINSLYAFLPHYNGNFLKTKTTSGFTYCRLLCIQSSTWYTAGDKYICIFLEQRKWKNKWKHEQCRGRRKGLTYILIARVVAWNSPNLTTCFVADCYIKYWLSRREKRNDDGIWSCLLEGKSWKQIIFGVRRKWVEKAYKLLGSRTNTHVTRQAELHSDPRTKGSQFKLWKGLFQKAAGQNFLTRRALNVWEKRKEQNTPSKGSKRG